ncbi:MAG: helix-turn-helix domain-containing protein [Armatimonadota bacterium]
MRTVITVCAAWRPLIAHAISTLLDKEYIVSLCNREDAERAKECAEDARLLVRPAPSTYCWPPFPACLQRSDTLQALLVSQGWVESQGAMRQAGYSGYLGPKCDYHHLTEAVDTLVEGGSFYHPGDRNTRVIDALTERQIQVLSMIGRGYTDQQIAQELNIGETTVRHHIEVLQGKFGTDRRGELAAMAALGGLCGEEPGWRWVTVVFAAKAVSPH